MLFENGLRSLKIYIKNYRATTKNIFKRSIIGMLREKRKWNHIKCSIKAREGRKIGDRLKKKTKKNHKKQKNREQVQ